MNSRLYEDALRRTALTAAGLLAGFVLAAFVYQLPAAVFPFLGGPWWLEWLAFAVLYMAYAAVSLPFDIRAGYWLPCHYRGQCVLLPVFLGRLFRAEAVQFAVMTLSALAALEAGKAWGSPGALASLAAAQALLAALRPQIARLMGCAAGPLPWRVWAPGFAWNLAGMALMLRLPWCGASSVYQLVQAFLGCSLWSLGGYWLLRARRRPAALALLYQSWACFGLFSRATAACLGSPQRWVGGEEPDGQEAAKNSCAASQISST